MKEHLTREQRMTLTIVEHMLNGILLDKFYNDQHRALQWALATLDVNLQCYTGREPYRFYIGPPVSTKMGFLEIFYDLDKNEWLWSDVVRSYEDCK